MRASDRIRSNLQPQTTRFTTSAGGWEERRSHPMPVPALTECQPKCYVFVASTFAAWQACTAFRPTQLLVKTANRCTSKKPQLLSASAAPHLVPLCQRVRSRRSPVRKKVHAQQRPARIGPPPRCLSPDRRAHARERDRRPCSSSTRGLAELQHDGCEVAVHVAAPPAHHLAAQAQQVMSGKCLAVKNA